MDTIVDKEDEKNFQLCLAIPYFKLDSKALKGYIDGYDAQNTWSAKYIFSVYALGNISLRTNGTMVCVPQSIRSGLYFKNLREEMKALRIKSILH